MSVSVKQIQSTTEVHFSEKMCCNRKMISSLVCLVVLVLQVQFIRGQLAHSKFIGGRRSDVFEPGYKVCLFQ